MKEIKFEYLVGHINQVLGEDDEEVLKFLLNISDVELHLLKLDVVPKKPLVQQESVAQKILALYLVLNSLSSKGISPDVICYCVRSSIGDTNHSVMSMIAKDNYSIGSLIDMTKVALAQYQSIPRPEDELILEVKRLLK